MDYLRRVGSYLRSRRAPRTANITAPKPAKAKTEGSGVSVKVRCDELSEGIQVLPPSTDNSVNTSKKLSMRNCPPPRSVMVVCPVEASVGLSRIMNGPNGELPLRFSA